MTSIVSIHSYRGGTGKSIVAANIGVAMAAQGLRVGIVTHDFISPFHFMFNVPRGEAQYSLDDFILNQCDIKDAAIDATDRLGVEIKGRIFLAQFNIMQGLKVRMAPEFHLDGIHALIQAFDLDIVLLDMQAGLSENNLLYISCADLLVEIMQPDQTYYHGTAVVVDIARSLDVSRILLVVNQSPSIQEADEVRRSVEQIYGCEMAAFVPLSMDMAFTGTSGIFSLEYPNHEITREFKKLTKRIVELAYSTEPKNKLPH